MAGWQWLFLLEGLPSVLLGLCVLAYLDDDIAGATWLTANEKCVLVEAIARDGGQKQEGSIVEALLDPRVWLTGAIYFCFVAGLYGFWLPTIISGMGVKSPLNVGFLTAMPYAAGAIGMVLVGKSADYHRERRWHVAIPAGLGATGLVFRVSLSRPHGSADRMLRAAAVPGARARRNCPTRRRGTLFGAIPDLHRFFETMPARINPRIRV